MLLVQRQTPVGQVAVGRDSGSPNNKAGNAGLEATEVEGGT
jgi:hypothetical protein